MMAGMITATMTEWSGRKRFAIRVTRYGDCAVTLPEDEAAHGPEVLLQSLDDAFEEPQDGVHPRHSE